MWTWIKYLDRVLRGEATRPSALQEGTVAQPVGGLSVIILLLGLLYGLCMGSYALFQGQQQALAQLLATMLKVPLLFFLTLVVTFPSLYVFNALVGSRLTMLSVLRLLIIALAVMLTILASLGPIVAFFAASTTSYPFMLLLNVVVFSVAGVLGLRYLLATLHRLSLVQNEAALPPFVSSDGSGPPPVTVQPTVTPAPTLSALDHTAAQPLRQEVRTVFRCWILVFGLVGAQMAWVLRPFLGSPDRAFTFFRVRESNVFEGIFFALRSLFG